MREILSAKLATDVAVPLEIMGHPIDMVGNKIAAQLLFRISKRESAGLSLVLYSKPCDKRVSSKLFRVLPYRKYRRWKHDWLIVQHFSLLLDICLKDT
jgi:hypothetical protein